MENIKRNVIPAAGSKISNGDVKEIQEHEDGNKGNLGDNTPKLSFGYTGDESLTKKRKTSQKGALSRIKDSIKAVPSKIKSGMKSLAKKIHHPFKTEDTSKPMNEPIKLNIEELSYVIIPAVKKESPVNTKTIFSRAKKKVSNMGKAISNKIYSLWRAITRHKKKRYGYNEREVWYENSD